MIRKRKAFSRPRKPFESSRIKEEDSLVKEYGLKNKKEIWRTLAKVNYFRSRAKALAKSSLEDQEILFNKLKYIGLNVSAIADVLGLKVEDLLNRRLPTVIKNKGISTTMKQARQLVVHKRILVGNQVINSPSYLVPLSLESSIKLRTKDKPIKAKKEIEASPEAN